MDDALVVATGHPCMHCGHGESLHAKGGCHVVFDQAGQERCSCPGFEPLPKCTRAHPMPKNPVPASFQTWTHERMVFEGVDRGKRKHSTCADCGTKQVQEKDGDIGLTPPGRIAGSERLAVLGDACQNVNQLLIGALNALKDSPIPAAMVIFVDAQGHPRVFHTDVTSGQLELMARAANLKANEHVARLMWTE